MGGQVAECPELLPERAADEEQEERGGHQDEWPPARRPVPPQPDDGRGHRGGAQEHERVLGQRAEEPGPVERDPAGSDDAHRERGALPMPIGVRAHCRVSSLPSIAGSLRDIRPVGGLY